MNFSDKLRAAIEEVLKKENLSAPSHAQEKIALFAKETAFSIYHNQGYDGHFNLAENPHVPETEAFNAWNEGWLDAEKYG